MTSADTARETHSFQADVNKVLDLVIHSLYSNKEIFLRELVSNASDALDKLRFRALTEPDLLRDDAALEIRVIPDATARTLTIADTGIGMTHDELVDNLGTVAHSGSQAFLAQLKEKKDLALIGQFGVGFYSAYLVADRVEVKTRAAGHDQAWTWASDARGTYTIEPAPPETPRGTAVVLHFKEEQKELLEEWRLRDLVSRYSDYVGHPIKLRVEKRTPDTMTEPGKATGETELQTINRASALWQRSKSEITDEQYAEFYRHLTHDFELPLARTHFRVEGTSEFVGLLFVPKDRPWDLDAQRVKRRGVRLFVKRVFIMDDCEEVLPQWLRFVRGVIDSDDLPLNVSREILQDSNIVRTIKKQVVKRTLDLLDELATEKKEDYAAFWKSFGTILKEGLALDGAEHKDRIAKLLRYESTKGEGVVSLAEYVARMPEGQPAIYYAYGESIAKLEGSPHLEALAKRGYEVLYMTDPVDEWASDSLREFDEKPLHSIMRADLDLPTTEEEKKETEERAKTLAPFLAHVKKVLDVYVREARVSTRLTDSPVCLVVPEGASHAYMEKLLEQSGRGGPRAKRILEINAAHPVIEHLRTLHEKDASSTRLAEWIELLHDQALLTEGSSPTDPNRFARLITSLLEDVATSGRP